MSQEQIMAPGGAGEPDEDASAAGQVQAASQGLDDLLDQIDAVLATDAQAFVEGFVQKGGQ